MKIRSQKREGNKVILEVEEDYSLFESATQRAIADAGREIRIPGFRPGKAPRDMVEKTLNPEYIESKAAQRLVSDLYSGIIEETKIDPVDYPNIDIIEQAKGKPFVFKVRVDVYPEVKLGKYKGLKAQKKAIEVIEEDVIKVLGNLQERFSAPGPLDDEFAKKVSQFGTMAELKEEIRVAIEKERTAEAESEVRNQLIGAVSGEAKVDIPAAMTEREIDVMMDELRTSLSQSGLTIEDYLRGSKKQEKELRDEMRKAAEIRVKGKVVLKAVADAEELAVSPDEMQKEIKELAQAAGRESEDLEKSMGSSGKSYVEEYLLRRKALDLLLEKADIKEGEK